MAKIKFIKNERSKRTHLGRCKNCGKGWRQTFYLDELEPDVKAYLKAKGYADNADICPDCVNAVKSMAKTEAFDKDEIDRFTVDDPNYIDHVVIQQGDSNAQAIVKITKVPSNGQFKVIALHSGYANPVTLMSGTFFGAAHEYEELADMDPTEALAVIANS